MNTISYTHDETNLMAIYGGKTKKDLIDALTEMQKYLDEDETELRELTDSTIAKLNGITDEQYAELDLTPDFVE